MTASKACLGLIKHYEGLYLVPYRCSAGVLTCGWGHTKGVVEDQVADEATASRWLCEDILAVETDLTKLLQGCPAVTQGEWDGLVSLCFNLAGGARALPKKAPKLWMDLKYGEKYKAAYEMLDMDHALVDGKPSELPGLKLRREAEAALFLS